MPLAVVLPVARRPAMATADSPDPGKLRAILPLHGRTTIHNITKKIITYLITCVVGNVVLLHPHVSGIFRKCAFTWINSSFEIKPISRLILAFNSCNM